MEEKSSLDAILTALFRDKSFEDIDFIIKNGVLDCNAMGLTSLEGCPSSVTTLYCASNRLISLKGCPSSVEYLNCESNELKSLEGLPEGIKYLNCMDNFITSLEECPKSVTTLYADSFNSFDSSNPLNEEYKNKTLEQIHQINSSKHAG